jgi:type II secretory pathway pseudopilin PulG
MSAEGRIDAAFGRATTRIARRLRHEAGFTLIEVLLTGVMLAIISAPISAILSQGAVIAKMARERTGADQLAQTQIESLRSIPYTQVGIVNGNPAGSLAASTSTALPSGEAVTVAWQITWVNDKVPENPYQSNADYKKVVLTVTRNSDNKLLTQKTTFVAAASAPPSAGTTWVQIKRTLQDAVTLSPIVGANVNLTGGVNSVNRNDTTDASGSVLFPALDPATNGLGTPLYTLLSTFSGYSVFPDDISPGAASSVSSSPGLSSISTIKMYKGTSLTVNVQSSAGAAWTTGATVSLDSSRCGVQTLSIPNGQSSATFTTCQYGSGVNVPLPPNVAGMTPAFANYYVTAWSTTGNFWSAGAPVAVPSNYPTTLTQSVNVKFNATAAGQTKVINVTVKKGGSNDANARVEVTGGPFGVYVYALTNGSGVATVTVPVNGTGYVFTANAMDTSGAKGTAPTASISTSTTSPIAVTVTVS